MNLIVDGLHLTGSDSGKGKKVALLLHGWGNDHKSFDQIKSGLKEFRVIVPDLPGFGGSQPPKEAWGVDDYAQLVVALLSKLKVSSVDLLIGHSFGGRISLVLSGDQLINIKKQILIASHGLPEPKTTKGRLLGLLASSGKILPRSVREPIGQRFSATDYKAAQGVMRDVFKKVVAQDATTQAQSITCPTLLIYGSQDHITPPSLGRQFNQLITGSKLEIVEDGDHHLHQHQSDLVSRLINEFIND